MLAELLLHLPAYRTDGLLLIVAVGDLVVNGNAHQVQPLGAAVHQLLQIILAEHAADLALRAALIVPKVGFKAVGGEHHRAAAEFSFQTVRIQNRLPAPAIRVLAGALCFHHRQRQTVFSEQYIVAVAHLTGYPGHTLHRVLLLHIRVRASKFPADILHIHIDKPLAGLEFGEVFGLEGALLFVLVLFGGVLGGHLLDLPAQRLNLRIFFIQQAFLLLDFLGVHHNLFGGNELLVKGALHIVRAVAVVNPLDKLKQAPQSSQRIARLHAALGMYRQIAQFDDKLEFTPSVIVHGKTERRLVDKGLQIVLVGHLHGLVRRIHPLDREFQCLAAAHRAHGWGGSVDFLGFHAGGGKKGVFRFGFKKREVDHFNHLCYRYNSILLPLFQPHQNHFVLLFSLD